jgi:hypothetical protein
MSITIQLTLIAPDRGSAIRLIRDAAAKVKTGVAGAEVQRTYGAFRFDLSDDGADVERPSLHPCKRCRGLGRIMTAEGIADCVCDDDYRDPISGAPLPRVFVKLDSCTCLSSPGALCPVCHAGCGR